MPSTEIPKQWTTPEDGGYWTEEMPQLDLVKIRNKRFKQELENFRMPEVYQAINTMQSTAFRINKFVLGVMQFAWDNQKHWGHASIQATR